MLLIYIPLLLVITKKPDKHIPKRLSFLQYLFFCLPLLIWMRLCHFLGIRALEPFISEIDSTLCIGSMPQPGDATLLKQHGVGLVVNMCYEVSI
jgi:hypothetical protein